MTETHHRVIQCSCGKTFECEDDFTRHKKRRQRKQFNNMAQDWLDEHLGGEIAKWHSSLCDSMGGIAAYQTAKETDGIGTEPTHENIRDAAIEFARGSLMEGNKEQLFFEEYHK
jgi:transposase